MNETSDPAQALVEVREALRRGRRHPPVIEMSRDPREAVAYAMAVIRGDDSIGKKEALDQLGARIDRLAVASSDEALRELAASVPLMETMMIRYAMQAAQTNDVDRIMKLTKLSVLCQGAMARTMALIAGLRLQRKGAGVVVIHEDGGRP